MPERSPRHYYPDERPLIIRVEDTLYRIPMSHVAGRSGTWADCLLMPQPDGDVVGSSDDTPLVLSSTAAPEFNAFLKFIFPDFRDTFTVDELEGLLKMSDMYDSPRGREFAVRKLTELSHVAGPTRMLALSIQYGVQQWFKPSFEALASFPLQRQSEDELRRLPADVLDALSSVRQSISAERHQLINNHPPVYRVASTAIMCSNDGTCSGPMMRLWRDVGHALLIGEPYQCARSILDRLSTASREEVAICGECQRFFRFFYCSGLRREMCFVVTAALRARRDHYFHDV